MGKKWKSNWGYNSFNPWGWGGGRTDYGSYDYKQRTEYGEFKHEMTGTTATLGRDKAINVNFVGDKVLMEGNNVTFPALDESLELSDDTLEICRGYADHATAKVRFSNRAILDKANKAATPKAPRKEKLPSIPGVPMPIEPAANQENYKLFAQLLDAVETVRTEKKFNSEYPGAKKNLTAVANAHAKNYLKKNDIEFNTKLSLKQGAPMAITAFGRKEMNYWGFELTDVINALEYSDRGIVKEWAQRALVLESTEESEKLAKEIYEYIKHDALPPPPSGGEGEDEDGEDGEGECSKDKKKKGKKEGEDGDGEDNFDSMPDMSEAVLNEMMKEARKSSGDKRTDDEKSGAYTVVTKKFDQVIHWSDKPPSKAAHEKSYGAWFHNLKTYGNIREYMKVAESLGPTISIARRRLENIIAAQRRTEWNYIKEAGKFDSRRMTSAMAGEEHVFKLKDNAPDIDTAVTVLVDLSGSMGGMNKRFVAAQSAIVLFECLSKIGIPFEVLGFDCEMSAPDIDTWKEEYSKTGKTDYSYYSRIEGLCTYVFKSFKDRPFDARPYIMGLQHAGGRNNSDGESVDVAHRRLLARPEKRKIMFVLSDGQPECATSGPGSGASQRKYLKKVVSDIEKRGTHIVGIGILTDAVKDYYTKYAIVKRAEDLAGIALKQLSEALLPKKRKIAVIEETAPAK